MNDLHLDAAAGICLIFVGQVLLFFDITDLNYYRGYEP